MTLSVTELNPQWLPSIPILKRPRGNPSGNGKIHYKNAICAFDIETSRRGHTDISYMYIWQVAIYTEVNGVVTIIGRTWDEFRLLLMYLAKACDENERFIFFVHNLSFEFQFLKGIYDFMPGDVFAVKKRKVLKCLMYNKIEFRCSYLLSNMSLDEFCKKMHVEHAKTTMDYSIERFPWTEISPEDMEYVCNDVVGLVESVKKLMEINEDTLYTIPLTSTGYVRRDAKEAFAELPHTWVYNQQMPYDIYCIAREAFRGGNCHANRYYADQIIENVHSFDRSSSYPDVLCNCKFPIEPFKAVPDDKTVEYMIEVRRVPVLTRVRLTNVRLTDRLWGCPYLATAKCRHIVEAEYDNGRILQADSLETSVTDIDWEIIKSEYSFDSAEFFDSYYSRYGKLPAPLIELIEQYYKTKTELKGVKGQEVFYTKSKNKLNSIYGMMAQDPVKQSIDFLDGMFKERNDDEEQLLTKYQSRAFLAYQWGVWTTAWARYRLEEGMRIAGDGFVYCDTDSVKYVGEADWGEYNEKRKSDSIESGAYATDPHGETHYMGVYESEGSYEKFKTLGAKKYAYVQNNELHSTISGVSKKAGAKELKSIDNFRIGFTFYEAAGNEILYNDAVADRYIYVDGKPIEITTNATIRPTTYRVGVTDEYQALLEYCDRLLDINKSCAGTTAGERGLL